MVASIGAVAAPEQGASYYERDGYYAKEDPEHRDASAWAGRGAEELGLAGPVDPDTFRAVLEGRVPDGSGKRLGRRTKDGDIHHRPGRDLTFSAPKSVSLAALVGGDARVVDAHDRAVTRTLDWFEKNVAETRMKDPATGRMARTGGQKTVIAKFTHDTSRNLDPALHTHSVIANMLKGADGKWRSMANEKLYASKMLLGAMYRNELARDLGKLGYGIEKTHADGRFEIAGVPRGIVEAFSTRRAEIEAAMERAGAWRNRGEPAPRPARRAVHPRRQARCRPGRAAGKLGETGGSPGVRCPRARGRCGIPLGRYGGRPRDRPGRTAGRGSPVAMPLRPSGVSESASPAIGETGPAPAPPEYPAARAVAWAVSHLSEREAVFARTDLLAAALAWSPGAAAVADIEREAAALEKAGTLHAARLPGLEDALTTDRAVADEKETVALMEGGRGRGAVPMRARAVDKALRNGPLTLGQREAVRLILSADDRTVGVQGYAGTGKTTMLRRARALMEKKGYQVRGLAPSASAARTLEAEAGIGSETLQRFLARHAGVAEGRHDEARGAKDMRSAFRKTALVVDEGSLASTVQTRDLLRIADALRIPRVVLVGDAKQLDAVDAGKPFAQLQAAGMKTAVMDEIMRQRDPALKEAVEASLAGEIGRAFDKLGDSIAEAKADNLAGAAAARWLALSPEERANAGLMAPSHTLRERINEIVRERLVRDGAVHGPAHERRAARKPRLYQCREDARRQLRARRRGGVPPSLQAARGRQG